jgi:mannobiose 2-epimerase
LKEKALAHTERIATAALEGRCYDGSMVYERHEDGAYDNDKHWWVQAENVIGQIYLWKYHNRPEMLEKAWQSWQYIRENLVDYDKGEWHWSRRSVDGSINRDDDKAGFWKCPYHNSRMCIEVFERLND